MRKYCMTTPLLIARHIEKAKVKVTPRIASPVESQLAEILVTCYTTSLSSVNAVYVMLQARTVSLLGAAVLFQCVKCYLWSNLVSVGHRFSLVENATFTRWQHRGARFSTHSKVLILLQGSSQLRKSLCCHLRELRLAEKGQRLRIWRF